MPVDRDDLQARLRALFEGELDDAIRGLNSGLVQLEAAIAAGQPAELIGELFRLAHGIKGAAQSAGIPDAVSIAHRLEDALAEIRDDNTGVDATRIAKLLSDVDALNDVHVALSEPPGGSIAAGVGADGEAVRVGIHKVVDVVEQAAALVGVSHRLNRALHALGAELDRAEAAAHDGAGAEHHYRAARDAGTQLARLTGEIRDAARGLGFEPFSAACAGLDRVLHDVAASSGKLARLVVTGGDVEIDRSVVAALREPLLHVVRNAVGHGIEQPERRAEVGKEPAGTVTVSAELRGGRLEITVTDDGGGLDRDAVRHTAAALGEDGEGDALTLVFRPRVTTAPTVTDVSGRGVGLDAVRERVESIGGSVRMLHSDDHGTTLRIVSPVSLSLMEVLVMSAGEETLCLPLSAVDRVARVPTTELEHLDGRPSLLLGDEPTPVISLLAAAGFPGVGPIEPGSVELVVIDVGGDRAAVVVDAVISHDLTTVRSLPPRVSGLRSLLGAAMLASGEDVLVLNPASCIARAREAAPGAIQHAVPGRGAPARVLLAEDTATTRALERSILEAAGFDVLVAVDGDEAWELLQRHGADAVVSDVHMPGTDGIELCALIRSSDRFADLPIVLVSSLGSEEDRLRGVNAGANAYLVKAEFDQATLLDVLDRLL